MWKWKWVRVRCALVVIDFLLFFLKKKMLLAILHFLTSVFAAYFRGTVMSLCLGVNFLYLVIELKINKKTINAIDLQRELSAGGTAGIKLVR